MSRPGSPMDQPDQVELLRQFQNQLAGIAASDVQESLHHLTGSGGALAGARPSPRGERRPDVVTYRVRVDLIGTEPPLWRRLELASDMFLDELHPVLQVAFGWTDSHLHRFSSGPNAFSPDTEHYLMPFEVEEGDEGVPEQEVRLDELLTDPGDRLFYAYDYGDGWEHSVRLEAVLPRAADVPRATCTAGRRPGPPEDCGGVHGYELFCAATDPSHAHHADARAEVAKMYGLEAAPEGLAPTPFVIDDVNEQLASLQAMTRLPEPLANLMQSVRDPLEQDHLRDLIGAAALDETTEIDPDTAARMVRPYAWLLDRVGEDGITLTGAGYLPPVHVHAAMTELGMAAEWIGKNNREVQTLPVLDLRESAQKMGLLRKHRGKLLLTTRGRRLRTEPAGLWWHVAEQTPLKSRNPYETQAGLVLLVAVATGVLGGVDATIARTLGAIGWMTGDGGPITGSAAVDASWGTRVVLRRLGALTSRTHRRDERSTPDGAIFARAALRAWP